MADHEPDREGRSAVRSWLAASSAEERRDLARLLAHPLWQPASLPQIEAFLSPADVTGYGAAAGGGKTDLALGLALSRHHVSAIFRRSSPQLSGVIERLAEIMGGRAGFNGQNKIWRLPGGRRIEFGSAPHAGDETKYQGRPKDLLVIDEAPNFLESQVRFLMGWVRTAKPGQRCRTLLTFNPPTTADGQWIVDFFAPWLAEGHPNPARPGELRWFAVIEGSEVEVAGARPFLWQDGRAVHDFDAARLDATDVVVPQSRTFIPARVTDNPFLMGTGYVRTLQAMPEPLRSQMLKGDFTAGLEDDSWQVIPSAWVAAAQGRWQARTAKGAMDSMGVDVARGGRDETVIAKRHGVWFDSLSAFPGTASPDGPAVAAQVLAQRRDRAPVHIDVVGWGASPYDFLRANDVQAIAVNGAEKSLGLAVEGGLRFANRRAEIWWRMREALAPSNPLPIAIPPDLCAPRWSLTQGGILVEAKEDIIRRLGRSPDKGDALCLANITTPKSGEAGGRPTFAAGADYDPWER